MKNLADGTIFLVEINGTFTNELVFCLFDIESK